MCLSTAMAPGWVGNMRPMGSGREQGGAEWAVAAAQGVLRLIWEVLVPVRAGRWDLASGSLCQQGRTLWASVVVE